MRTCPKCGGRSYSSYSGPRWDCPYCGKDLGDVPNEMIDNPKESLKEEPLRFQYMLQSSRD